MMLMVRVQPSVGKWGKDRRDSNVELLFKRDQDGQGQDDMEVKP